jgi:hypothetical protein
MVTPLSNGWRFFFFLRSRIFSKEKKKKKKANFKVIE